MSIINLSFASMRSRSLSSSFTIISIAISVCLLLGVNRVKEGMRSSFESTISGTDLLVGPRGGDLSLLLMSVFNLGNPTNSLSEMAYDFIKNHEQVAWTVPLSIGDSYRGYRVVGTTSDYVRYIKFGNDQMHQFQAGGMFTDEGELQAVVGAEVSASLGLKLGSKLVLEHGLDAQSIHSHDDDPFEVVGVLKASGTPADRCVFVSLAGIEAIHEGWEDGVPPGEEAAEVTFDSLPPVAEDIHEHRHSHRHDHEHDHDHDHEELAVSAVLVGLKSQAQTLQLQRQFNEFEGEALSAVIPGIALGQLWQMADIGERALVLLGILVVLSAILGMLASVLGSLNERRREIAVLRALGASPQAIVMSLSLEGFILGGLGFMSGFFILQLGFFAFKYFNGFGLGIYIGQVTFGAYEGLVLLWVLAASFFAGLIFALRGYSKSLADGLTIKC